MFQNDNTLAWFVYLIAAFIGFIAWLQLTGWITRHIRGPLTVIIAVLLFSPTVADPNTGALSPAIAVIALDTIFHVGNNAWRAVADLVLYLSIGLLLYIVFMMARWFYLRHVKIVETSPKASKAISDNKKIQRRPLYTNRPSVENKSGDLSANSDLRY